MKQEIETRKAQNQEKALMFERQANERVILVFVLYTRLRENEYFERKATMAKVFVQYIKRESGAKNGRACERGW